MIIDRDTLLKDAADTGFRPDVLEKVYQLLRLLDAICTHPYVKDRVVLKGGTAINLFVFDIPRLSVDIDLNYIGSSRLSVMEEERKDIGKAMAAICRREGFNLHPIPYAHAGGKWRLSFPSSQAKTGKLELDINYLLRVPIWQIQHASSRAIGLFQINDIPLLDLHELTASKVVALLSRRASRDLFDTSRLLALSNLDRDRLRIAFVVYGGISRVDLRGMSPDEVVLEPADLQSRLLPLLSSKAGPDKKDIETWFGDLKEECRRQLNTILPLKENELGFLQALLEHGEIKPTLLTDDPDLVERIGENPGLHWKALNVRKHRGTE